ncbi:hypothetical protein [Rhodococcus sp. BS-15]|nr:hypothetical protein [Rhodococcus sp. BS-15]
MGNLLQSLSPTATAVAANTKLSNRSRCTGGKRRIAFASANETPS